MHLEAAGKLSVWDPEESSTTPSYHVIEISMQYIAHRSFQQQSYDVIGTTI